MKAGVENLATDEGRLAFQQNLEKMQLTIDSATLKTLISGGDEVSVFEVKRGEEIQKFVNLVHFVSKVSLQDYESPGVEEPREHGNFVCEMHETSQQILLANCVKRAVFSEGTDEMAAFMREITLHERRMNDLTSRGLGGKSVKRLVGAFTRSQAKTIWKGKKPSVPKEMGNPLYRWYDPLEVCEDDVIQQPKERS